ncbi:hypothetical protein BDR03DRAFT_878888 [Suillus americanus]|nr:hypothetical protein BDR03DRAFT_878888 [Suillus americanus]
MTEPYSVISHPSYLGALAQSIGMFVFHGLLSLLFRCSDILNIFGVKVTMLAVLAQRMTAIIALMLGIKNEDEMMKSIAKDERVNWAKKVKYQLTPGIY